MHATVHMQHTSHTWKFPLPLLFPVFIDVGYMHKQHTDRHVFSFDLSPALTSHFTCKISLCLNCNDYI